MGKKTATAVILLGIAFQGARQTTAQDSPKTVEVHVKRFAFTPNEITVKKGETVEITLISEDVTHALAVPELNISQEVNKGHPEHIVITPQTAGDFNGQCARFCGAGHGTMKFTVHVTE